MAFVVKATGRTGTVCWLSAANEKGFRTLSNRAWADVFQNVVDARTAIAKLPRAFVDIGLTFSVESVD
jgi:hypothetical protein